MFRLRRASLLRVCGVCVLVAGAFAVGAARDAGAATSPSTVIANQGAPGTSAWKVDGSGVTQPVSGSVAVNNFPANQVVSGSVAVNNFPASQTVSGSVSSADTTTVLASGKSVLPATSQSGLTGVVDISRYKSLAFVSMCSIESGDTGSCSGAVVQTDFFAGEWFPGSKTPAGDASTPGYVSWDTPRGEKVDVGGNNSSSGTVHLTWALLARTN